MVWLLSRGIAICSLLPIAVERCRWARCSRWPRVQSALGCLLLVAVVAIGAMAGCGRSRPSKADVPGTEASEPDQSEGEESAPIRDYEFVSERNVFRPLVVAPKGDSGGSASSGPPSAARGTGGSQSGQSPRTPTRPPDPTADLAITGITETTAGLRVLIERISTHEGKYAAVGDVVFGFTVQGIARGSVALAQGEKEYELKLGQKEIATTPVVGQTTEKPETPTAPTTSTSSSSSTSPFGGRMDWRNMSPEDRQAAMEQRRTWWEGLSESERDRYRSGFSRGSDRAPRSDRGRGGPPGR